MTDAAKIKDTRRKLEAAGVEYCYASYVDVHGVPKAKVVPLASFEKMAAGSELFTVGAMDGMGLVGPEKDECAAVPDLDSLIVLPWDKRFAWFASDLSPVMLSALTTAILVVVAAWESLSLRSKVSDP